MLEAVFSEGEPRKLLVSNPAIDHRSSGTDVLVNAEEDLSYWNTKKLQGTKLDPALCSKITALMQPS